MALGFWTVMGKLSTFIPGRVEQLKNEKARLLYERSCILDRPASAANSLRWDAIDRRVSEINSILGNKASD